MLHLDRLAERLRSASTAQLKDAHRRLEELAQRARLALEQGILARRHRVSRLAASLDALSPLGVLARGYSLTLLSDGKTVIRDSQEVNIGELIHTRLAAGSIASQVVSTERRPQPV